MRRTLSTRFDSRVLLAVAATFIMLATSTVSTAVRADGVDEQVQRQPAHQVRVVEHPIGDRGRDRHRWAAAARLYRAAIGRREFDSACGRFGA